LQTSDDLKTNACTTSGAPPPYIQDALRHLHATTIAKYYGCGVCIPHYDLTGARVLDLGCGAGRDVYLAAQFVGPTGRVVGVDMTEQQLQAAREYQSYHATRFGYNNTAFHFGYLEHLDDIPELEPASFDVIISNCVINLCTDKAAVLQACFNLLKPGGELYFSDVYANRRVPVELQRNEVLWGECLSGALYWNDFVHLAKTAGFRDPRLVEDKPISVQNAAVTQLFKSSGYEALEFYSATYRLLKIEELEPDCEDYGQAVIYKGTIPRAESVWTLDKGHVFEMGKIHPVCGNTWNMLEKNPRLKPHFTFVGDFSRHYGIFEGCGTSMPYDSGSAVVDGKGGGGSCC
jgi:arsenite methyltransferase